MTRRALFLRIDDRLVHGQVIVGWLPHLQAEALLILNEKVAMDPIRQDMMGLSVPQPVRLLFGAPGDIPAIPEFPAATMVLVASPKDAWLSVAGGLVPDQINIGGLHSRPGKEELREALHLDAEDRDYLKRILEQGFSPLFQPTPQNEPEPLLEILS